MKEMTKRVLLRSGKSFALLTLIMSCLFVAAVLLWQYQTTALRAQFQQQKQEQHTFDTLSNTTSANIFMLKNQLESVAQRPILATLLAGRDAVQITQQQQALFKVFPSAKNICLIDAGIDEIDNHACLPITYATLESLRQAKTEGSSSLGLMQVGSDAAHLLLARRILDQDNQVVGVLVVTLSPDWVASQLFVSDALDGYAELQQGQANSIVLATQGDARLKQGLAHFHHDLVGTHWKIAYWPQKLSDTSPPYSLISLILGVMILMWFLGELTRKYIHKTDIATLEQQLVDLSNGVMKIKYAMIDDTFANLSAHIQTLGKTMTAAARTIDEASRPTESTSERIRKKLDADTTGNSAEFDMFDQAINIDKRIFKAYDIRGMVGDSLNAEIVALIGRAIGSQAQELGISHIVVGRDGRHSSPEFSEALIAGILGSGCDVSNLGMVPTPVLYFASHHLDIASSVMVTGSHNPSDYNGLKIVLAGDSIAGDDLLSLYHRIEDGQLLQGKGSLYDIDIIHDYLQRITDDIQLPRQIKVVIDSGNGVTGHIAPKLFRALGCDVVELFCDIDGDFPNHNPDPSQPDNMQKLIKAVEEYDAELGIAFDGDGDRLGVVDTLGNMIFPDRLMILFAQDLLLRLPGSVIIYDVKSSHLLGEAISRAGGEAIMLQSGHSVIRNKMREMEAQLAGELSGHIFFKERWYGFDDGMYAAARLLELLCQDPLTRTPTEIFAAMPQKYTTPEMLLAMDAEESRRFIVEIQKDGDFSGAQLTTIDGLRADYPYGWGLVRASNTMPGLTLRFEGDTEQDLYQIQQIFKQQILQIKPTLTVSFPDKITSLPKDNSASLDIEDSLSLSFDEPISLSIEEPLSPVEDESHPLALEEKSSPISKDTQ